ncbi:30S ribosomal protein S17 [Candidatus Peregrinibacteria bacterium CG10_big_fil_rev_8_21_14_0_10_49_16]|nr:MAG: 30S ribosomal protein S17 [Candidatus Peregrinibacteria bacterium CG22_combo_CG10-13_8_21_14_all_49_11]PIR51832.1 MAG: 30S ribosomal protein S17 [Candidatus Peregrinibacteria bacterium CG10_big_fil_rev_8_21_14_0_10_49_16]
MTTKRGIVSGTKMTGTVSVTVERYAMHPIYRKQFRVSKAFLVDPNGIEVGKGDEVEITECRPISKRKHFKITKVIKTAPRTDEMHEEEGVEEAMHRGKDPKDVQETQDSKETSISFDSSSKT